MSNQSIITNLLHSSSVHEEWITPLSNALQTIEPDYLQSLIQGKNWLPGSEKLFSAFQRDLTHCQYVLFGESPYPRKESANGIAFYDAAVDTLWSDNGLSKPVNRATSLRNIMKTALVAQGLIEPESNGKIPQSTIAAVDKHDLIQNIQQLFTALQNKGFLLFNATPVLHPDRKPAKEAKYWTSFVLQLLIEIKKVKDNLPTLVLWGKVALQIEDMSVADEYPKLRSEHPYNISFIHNKIMLQLFSQLKILSNEET